MKTLAIITTTLLLLLSACTFVDVRTYSVEVTYNDGQTETFVTQVKPSTSPKDIWLSNSCLNTLGETLRCNVKAFKIVNPIE